MTRLCVFSDIHGNGAAFDAALKAMLAERADQYIFLGDLCGYYYQAREIFDGLMSIPGLRAVIGNHDAMYLRVLDGDTAFGRIYRAKYGSSIDRLAGLPQDGLTAWLRSLPSFVADDILSFYACHGAPGNPLEEYIYPDTPLDSIAGFSHHRLLLLGHTHHHMVRTVGDVMLCNPGSIGQPRDGNRSSYMVIDLPQRQARAVYIEYDNRRLVKDVVENDPDVQYLRTVLLRVRAE